MDFLLKANAVIILFYLCYRLFLQRETFFMANRFFLLSGLILSCVIPLISIPIYVENTVLSTFEIANSSAADVSVGTSSGIDYLQILFWLYCLGLIYFVLRFAIEVFSLARLLRGTSLQKRGSFSLIETENSISPFSFFNRIVYNPKHFSLEEQAQILAHETVHVAQNHTIDLILAKLACMCFWFNPFIWLYSKALQHNLEFIADTEAQQECADHTSYQTLLLKTVISQQKLALVAPFYNSLIKKRIIMLNKSKSKRLNLWKYSLVLPLLALFLMSFNRVEIPIPQPVYNASEAAPMAAGEVEMIMITKDFTTADFKNAKAQFSKHDINLRFSGIKRNDENEITAIKASYKGPNGATGNYAASSDKPIQAFSFFYDSEKKDIGFGGASHDMHFGDGQHFTFSSDDEDAHVVTSSKTGSHVFVIRSDEEQEDHEEHEEEIEHEEYHDSEKVIEYIIKDKDDKVIKKRIKVTKGQPNIFIKKDGESKIILKESEDRIIIKDELGNIIKDEIIKNKDQNTWVESDGEIIELDNDDNKIFISSSSTDAALLILLDGKEISQEDLGSIDPETIESMNVYKGETAVKKYGEKAKNGVIIISLKK